MYWRNPGGLKMSACKASMCAASKADSPSSMMLTTTPRPVMLFFQTGITFRSNPLYCPCANYTHTDTHIILSQLERNWSDLGVIYSTSYSHSVLFSAMKPSVIPLKQGIFFSKYDN